MLISNFHCLVVKNRKGERKRKYLFIVSFLGPKYFPCLMAVLVYWVVSKVYPRFKFFFSFSFFTYSLFCSVYQRVLGFWVMFISIFQCLVVKKRKGETKKQFIFLARFLYPKYSPCLVFLFYWVLNISKIQYFYIFCTQLKSRLFYLKSFCKINIFTD